MKLSVTTGFCLFILLLLGCGAINSDNRGVPEKIPNSGRTFVFTCSDGLKFVARTIEGGQAWLFLPSGTLNLQESTSGTYISEGATFNLSEEQTQLEERGVKHSNCINNRQQAIWEHAKLNGADFRAIGNEPGWNMEISQQSKLILVTDYGAQRHEFDLPEPEINQQTKTTVYKFNQAGEDVSLEISGEACSDSMSGEAFQSKVEISINGKVLRGCGRALH